MATIQIAFLLIRHEMPAAPLPGRLRSRARKRVESGKVIVAAVVFRDPQLECCAD